MQHNYFSRQEFSNMTRDLLSDIQQLKTVVYITLQEQQLESRDGIPTLTPASYLCLICWLENKL